VEEEDKLRATSHELRAVRNEFIAVKPSAHSLKLKAKKCYNRKERSTGKCRRVA